MAADLREAWKRQRGAAGEAEARSELLAALWQAGEREPGAARALYTEAVETAATAPERVEAMWRQAQWREKAGETNGALTLYVALLSEPDVRIPPAVGDADWAASGSEAALTAARLAADRGDLGVAEAILQRALALCPPADRVAVAEALVALYARMQWPDGACRLRDEWSASSAAAASRSGA